jgi:release factor glutamine methyltransferase
MKRSDCQNPYNSLQSISLGNWLLQSRECLRKLSGEPNSSLYALASHVLDHPTYWIQAHPEFVLEPAQHVLLNQYLDRLVNGEPLAYLTGLRAFFGMDFQVNPFVLIPRPETELLVAQALDWLGEKNKPCQAADVGTGSGCIAISTTRNSPRAHFIATDISLDSLLVAKMNCGFYGQQHQIDLLQTDLLSAVDARFDLVCANLPYIPTQKLLKLDVIRFEPRLALDGGEEGLDCIDRLLNQIQDRIQPDGLILLEIESSQGQAMKTMIHGIFPSAGVKIIDDLGGLPRLVRIEMRPA